MSHPQPQHFTLVDFLKAMFGSFFVGLTFLFKGSMVEFSAALQPMNIALIILFTFLLVTAEIYILSYKFVKNKKQRPFPEFWAKRFFAIISCSFLSLYLMVYLYGINNLVGHAHVLKLTTAIFLPAATAGAAIEIVKQN